MANRPKNYPPNFFFKKFINNIIYFYLLQSKPPQAKLLLAFSTFLLLAESRVNRTNSLASKTLLLYSDRI